MSRPQTLCPGFLGILRPRTSVNQAEEQSWKCARGFTVRPPGRCRCNPVVPTPIGGSRSPLKATGSPEKEPSGEPALRRARGPGREPAALMARDCYVNGDKGNERVAGAGAISACSCRAGCWLRGQGTQLPEQTQMSCAQSVAATQGSGAHHQAGTAEPTARRSFESYPVLAWALAGIQGHPCAALSPQWGRASTCPSGECGECPVLPGTSIVFGQLPRPLWGEAHGAGCRPCVFLVSHSSPSPALCPAAPLGWTAPGLQSKSPWLWGRHGLALQASSPPDPGLNCCSSQSCPHPKHQ